MVDADVSMGPASSEQDLQYSVSCAATFSNDLAIDRGTSNRLRQETNNGSGWQI
jgi:hypothetical protein